MLPGTPRLVLPADAPEEEWLQARKLGLGGSEIAAACGVDDYQTPLELYLRKTSLVPDVETSEPMQWGTRLQDVIVGWAAEQLDVVVEASPGMLQHSEHEWVLANVDGLLPESVLEAKVASRADAWKDGAIPVGYEAQARWYMLVTGHERAVIAALLHGTHGVLREVERDERIEDLLLRRGAEFWERVQERRPPAADHRALRALGSQYAVEGQTIDLHESWRPRLAQRRRLQDELDQAQKALGTLKAQLEADMGQAVVAYLDGEAVASFKPHQRRAYTVKASTQRPLRFLGDVVEETP
jgi:putative phage-type endonuclease